MLKGKKALILGLASKHSIAHGIAEAFHDQGAELALTYQNEKLKSRVETFAENWQSEHVFPCDVACDSEIKALAEHISGTLGSIDILVHSIGYAPSQELEGSFVEVCSREGFKIAHDISTYSFIALAQVLKPLMSNNASLLTLTYHGSTQTLPNYNVMGLAKASLEASVRYLAQSFGDQQIRVNAISAGPIKTLAASGIASFRKMLKASAQRSPLKRNVTQKEVGNAAAFLCSSLASGITGEVLYVDAGFSTCALSEQEME